MSSLINDFNYDYNYNVFLAKAMLPNLPNMADKSNASRWIQKLDSCNKSIDEMRLRNEFIYFLVLNMQEGILQAPFNSKPPGGSVLTFSHLLVMQKSGRVVETVAAALARLEDDLATRDKNLPAARLAVRAAELASVDQEIQLLEENTSLVPTDEHYGKTFHQLFMSLGLYKNPKLGPENEDFVANINRKEMRRLELGWLLEKRVSLAREKAALTAELARMRALGAQLENLLNAFSGRPSDSALEAKQRAARGVRDVLAASALRLRAAAEHAHAAVRHIDDALVAWQLAPNAKNSYERTVACADACRMLVYARCCERGARRVLSASAAPRAARAVRLALDYAFTDAVHQQKFNSATETFTQFKESVITLINSIHQVLLTNIENLNVAEEDIDKIRKELSASRINAIAKKGLADLKYKPKTSTRPRSKEGELTNKI